MKRIALLLVGWTLTVVPVGSQTIGRLDIGVEEGIDESEEIEALASMEEKFVLEKAVDPETYILGPGDEIGLSILAAENITLPLIVSPTGDLLIPGVGMLPIAGLTFREAQSRIELFVKGQAYPSAKINISLINLRRFRVQVVGAVRRPGFVAITSLSRLTDAVGRARGFHQFAREWAVELRRADGRAEVINVLRFIRDGDLSANPILLEGDVIEVPFGDVDKEGVVLRGFIKGGGYDLQEPGETLDAYLRRSAVFRAASDLESVTVTRMAGKTAKTTTVLPGEFKTFSLKAGDTIDILRERGVMVNGFVQSPGGYQYFPGFTAADYISIAGGNTPEGSPNRVLVQHLDGTRERGQKVQIRRGDVVVVPRELASNLFGQSSFLEVVASVASVYLGYLAATR